MLNKIDLTDYIAKNKKYSEEVLKCIAVSDNKNIDFKLLKAPKVTIDENSNILFDVNYKDLIEHRKILRKIEEISNIDDEIKKSIIDYSIILCQASNLSVNNIKLVK